jgi:flavin reductase (DIM6/NTAB) family NADH-FMN oxidoreductase RutF
MQIPSAYDQAIKRKYPEQVAVAIAKDRRGRYNPITLGWTMITSHKPPMMAISVGHTRYSLEVVRHAREFVLAFPSSAMAAETLLYGTESGRDADKLAIAGANIQPATKVDAVLLADAVANFECKLVSELETGDHVIFVGEVIAAHMNDDPAVGRLYSLGGDRLGSVSAESTGTLG